MKPTVELFSEMLHDVSPRKIVEVLYKAAVLESEDPEDIAILARAFMTLSNKP